VSEFRPAIAWRCDARVARDTAASIARKIFSALTMREFAAFVVMGDVDVLGMENARSKNARFFALQYSEGRYV
jgi:hypothetical protein